MARRRGEGALGGDRAGEGWAREKELTGGVGLPVREVRARESGEELTGGARWSVDGRGARFGPPGPEERGESGRARAGLGFGPAEGGERVFPFPFLILILFFFFSTFVSFCFFFPCNKNSLNELG